MRRRRRRSCASRSRSTSASSSSCPRTSSSSAATRSSARWARSSRRRPEMYYELALISVLVAGGYWGWYFVRHDQTRLYGVLQVAAAGLCGLGLIGHRLDKAGLGVPGAIGVGAGVCLLVIGPLARGLARRFAAGERF